LNSFRIIKLFHSPLATPTRHFEDDAARLVDFLLDDSVAHVRVNLFGDGGAEVGEGFGRFFYTL
jgi:hypothetical protein